MSGHGSKRVDLVAVTAELSTSYVVLGRLALDQPLEEDSLLCQIKTLTDIFDNQLLCSVCHLSSVPQLFHTHSDGILCEKCYHGKLFQPSSSSASKQDRHNGDSPDSDDSFHDDGMMIDILQCELKNVEKICSYLLCRINEESSVSHEDDESDDPEVQFSFFSRRKSSKQWNKNKSKLAPVLRSFLTRLNRDQLSAPQPPVLIKIEEMEISGNDEDVHPHTRRSRELHHASSDQNEDSLKNATKRGCRCGTASSTPGKLTCCGQRCPCYTNARGCTSCKCRGCRNSYGLNSEKGPGSGSHPDLIKPNVLFPSKKIAS